MRDPADHVTLELPGYPPPAPMKQPEPTIAERRLRCVYQDPKTVRTCRNCRHLEVIVVRPDSVCETTRQRCKLHRFDVALGALCEDHEE